MDAAVKALHARKMACYTEDLLKGGSILLGDRFPFMVLPGELGPTGYYFAPYYFRKLKTRKIIMQSQENEHTYILRPTRRARAQKQSHTSA